MYVIKYGNEVAKISKLEIGLSTQYVKTTTRSICKWDKLEKKSGRCHSSSVMALVHPAIFFMYISKKSPRLSFLLAS